MDEKVAPYSVEEFMNSEKEMNRILEQSAIRYKTPVNAVFAKLSDLTKLTMKDLVKWGRSNSVWPMQFGLACCAMELLDFGSARLDAERKGYLLFRGTPRQTDVMIVAGWVTKSMVPRVKRMYEQMAKPNYVIAYGECATSGGPWWESYNIIQGIDQVLPVDVYVAGCPPKPENLFSALIKLQEKISGKTAGNTEQSISENIRRTEDSRL
ncbi:MAG TPA: NADH-quinone oxidoreductase subunit NuoB [Candidatus Baltobacteraceae bacterium]|nr:NADH-quinone oxidoreductase subunit NuoB [Candidatus Baltobacteraceae bacterium]